MTKIVMTKKFWVAQKKNRKKENKSGGDTKNKKIWCYKKSAD